MKQKEYNIDILSLEVTGKTCKIKKIILIIITSKTFKKLNCGHLLFTHYSEYFFSSRLWERWFNFFSDLRNKRYFFLKAKKEKGLEENMAPKKTTEVISRFIFWVIFVLLILNFFVIYFKFLLVLWRKVTLDRWMHVSSCLEKEDM